MKRLTNALSKLVHGKTAAAGGKTASRSKAGASAPPSTRSPAARAVAPASKPSKAAPSVPKAGTDANETARKPMTRATASNNKPASSPAPARAAGTKARGVKPAARPSDEPARLALPARVDLPEGYKPGPGDEYMGPMQLEYFRQKLLQWRADLVEESKQTIDNLRDEVRDVGDEAERATRETENSLELRTRDRYRKLIGKIDKALRRIDEGAYGYCEETGEEIGIERLEARPIATLSLDAQERWEHRQKLMGD
jgi:DnaK suppressor protein